MVSNKNKKDETKIEEKAFECPDATRLRGGGGNPRERGNPSKCFERSLKDVIRKIFWVRSEVRESQSNVT